jgi:N-methylhydantoinase B
LLREVKVLETECDFSFSATRLETAPWGLFGGGEGSRAKVTIKRNADLTTPDRDTLLLPGDSVIVQTAGSGGYGKPEDRRRDLIERDLRERKISDHTARKVYGLKT